MSQNYNTLKYFIIFQLQLNMIIEIVSRFIILKLLMKITMKHLHHEIEFNQSEIKRIEHFYWSENYQKKLIGN